MNQSTQLAKVQQWHGNAGAVIRCWAYYRRYGYGLKDMSEHAVLNANYLRHALHREAEIAGVSHMFADGAEAEVAKHDYISPQPAKESVGVSAMDVAKVCWIKATWHLQFTFHWLFPNV